MIFIKIKFFHVHAEIRKNVLQSTCDANAKLCDIIHFVIYFISNCNSKVTTTILPIELRLISCSQTREKIDRTLFPHS